MYNIMYLKYMYITHIYKTYILFKIYSNKLNMILLIKCTAIYFKVFNCIKVVTILNKKNYFIKLTLYCDCEWAISAAQNSWNSIYEMATTLGKFVHCSTLRSR